MKFKKKLVKNIEDRDKRVKVKLLQFWFFLLDLYSKYEISYFDHQEQVGDNKKRHIS